MVSLRQLLTFGLVAGSLILPAQVFGQIQLTLKDGAVTVDGKIAATDPNDRVRMNPCNTYTVELSGGKTYQIDMFRKDDKDFDPYLRLEDQAGKELAKDDDSGGNLNARIIFTAPKDGKYTVIATTDDGGIGKYGLSIKSPTLIKGPLIKLADGKVEVNGVLGKDDPKYRGDAVCKVYLVKLKAGKTYQIDMASKEVDSYLRLENAKGVKLAEDDDSGGDLNASITFDCKGDGDYRITATTFGPGFGPSL